LGNSTSKNITKKITHLPNFLGATFLPEKRRNPSMAWAGQKNKKKELNYWGYQMERRKRRKKRTNERTNQRLFL
jgi:hypothetical protein